MSTRTPSADQELAIRTIEEGGSRYSLLTAAPGCGKSTVVRALYDMGMPIILTATTGIAAVNLGAASTINSLLGYFDTDSMRQNHNTGRIYEALKKYSGKLVVVDEVSMFSAGQFEILMLNNERLAQIGEGVRFLFVGDFGQLPPVKESPVFDSSFWEPHVQVLTLNQVHRTSDKEFIAALGHLRVGGSREALPYFNSLGFHGEVDMNFEGTTLYSINAGADAHNKHSLRRLHGDSCYYTPTIKGDPLPEWKNIPSPLELKEGALVILRSNKWDEGYANGDQGYVLSMTPDCVVVELLRGGVVHVGATTIKYKTSTRRGEITYMPIILAYALTTHKAQSLSIDHLQVVLDDPQNRKNLWFMSQCHGMAFMGVSRSTTPQNLRLVGNSKAFLEACYCDRKYIPHIL